MALIMVLDDSPDIIALLRAMLEGRGYEIMAGRNGQEGLNMLDQSPLRPAAIISNLMMPLMDGMAFLDAVRSSAAWGAIPFVMLTALSTDDYRQAAFAHGADAFVAKPFRLDDIQRALISLGIGPN